MTRYGLKEMRILEVLETGIQYTGHRSKRMHSERMHQFQESDHAEADRAVDLSNVGSCNTRGPALYCAPWHSLNPLMH